MKRAGTLTVYLILVFVCGLSVGVFGHHLYYTRTVSANAPKPPEEWKKRHMKEMRERLGLTSEQAAQLSTILDDTRAQYHVVMEKNRPELERIQADQYARVKAILRPEQIPAYDRYHSERDRIRRESNRKGM